MDTWGQGPWFDPEAADQDQPPHDEDQPDQQRGAPDGASDAPLRWSAESALAQGAESDQGPDAHMPAGGDPNAGHYGDAGAAGDAIADAPTRAYPPIAAGPRSLPGDPAASSPRGYLPFPYTPLPRSRPLSQPLDFGTGTPMAATAGMAGVAGIPGGIGGIGGIGGMGAQSAGREDQQRDKRRRTGVRALFVIVPVVLLLLACLGAGLLSNALLHLPGSASGAPSAQSGDSAGGPFTILPTGTPTSRPTPTPRPSPTPVPPPTAATITFTAASQSLTSPGAMTACPAKCDLTATVYANSQLFSATRPATQVPQSSLFGTIHVVNAGSQAWDVTSFSFTGGGFTCTPLTIHLPAGGSFDYGCFISATTPASIPAGTIQGTASASPKVTYTQPAALQGNGGYEVLPQDCTNALDNVKTQGAAWAQSWITGQTLPAGWQFAQSAPTIISSGDLCKPGPDQPPQATTFNFTASSTTNVSDVAYHPNDAQALAASRLAGQVPGGDALQNGSQTTCAPAVQGVSGATITVTCSDAGTAVATWTADRKAQLTAALAGQSKTAALAACNATPGVQANSCAISIQGGDGTLLPASAAVITVDARLP